MKNIGTKINNIIKKTAEIVAYNSQTSACTWWHYQPKVPRSLRKKK